MFGVWFLIRLLMVLGNRISRMWVIWLWTMGLRVCWDCGFYFYVVSHDPVPMFSHGAARELGGLWASQTILVNPLSFVFYRKILRTVCFIILKGFTFVLKLISLGFFLLAACSFLTNASGSFHETLGLEYSLCLQKPLTSPHSDWLSSHPLGSDRRALLLHPHAWDTRWVMRLDRRDPFKCLNSLNKIKFPSFNGHSRTI